MKKKHIYVYAPANSISSMPKEMILRGKENLELLGFTITFANNIMQNSRYGVVDIKYRIQDFNLGLRDASVDIMLAVYGGYNSSSLLEYIDFDEIQRSNKVFVGNSDITAVLNAIYSKTKQKSILGMGFSGFCDPYYFPEVANLFLQILDKKTISYISPKYYAEDLWYLNKVIKPRDTYSNIGFTNLNDGIAKGVIVGGNLETLLALSETEYRVNYEKKILVIESVPNESPAKFLREIVTLKYQGVFEKIRGLVIGSFSKESLLSDSEFLKYELLTIMGKFKFPIIANSPFSHIDPIYPICIGAEAELSTSEDGIIFKVNN